MKILATLPCAVFVLIAASDNIEDLRPLVPKLLSALAQRHMKKIIHVTP